VRTKYTACEYESAAGGCGYDFLMQPVRRMLGTPRGPVLDLGCGNGAMACELLAAGFDMYGVDASASGIALANQRAPGRFFVHDLYAGRLPEPLQGRRFQTVIATEVIEHLYDPRVLLQSVRGILAPGGELILSTPYHGYLKNLALAVTGKLESHFTVLWDGGHIKFFSRRTLETMLGEQGFTLVEFSGVGRLPWLWMSMLVKARVA
jgi:2-polyprenyl-3-methyl-5-hydroxy-6-metoxy-1,4-benzoquinol methylase